jgi:hypothetical protein
MNTADTKKSTAPLQLRWLRLKRHLRSCNDSTRALRDAARAQSVSTPAPLQERLCRRSTLSSLAA